MAGILFGFPSKNIAPSATPSWAVSSADASFPVANVLTLEPDTVAKATATTATLRLTFSGSETPLLLAFINTNWGGASAVSVSNNGGMTPQSVTVQDTEHGQVQNGWVDLRGLANVAATQFDIAVTGAVGNVAIGTVLVFAEIASPRVQWGYEMSDVFPTIEQRASDGRRFVYARGTNVRTLKATVHWAEDRELMRSLRRETRGGLLPFLMIPDEDDSDAMLVQIVPDATPEQYQFFSGSFADDTAEGLVLTALDVEEVNAGAAL